MKKNRSVAKISISKPPYLQQSSQCTSKPQQKVQDPHKSQSFISNNQGSQPKDSGAQNKNAELLAAAFSYQKPKERSLRRKSTSNSSQAQLSQAEDNATPSQNYKIDKSSDLVSIRNGQFSHQRFKSSFIGNKAQFNRDLASPSNHPKKCSKKTPKKKQSTRQDAQKLSLGQQPHNNSGKQTPKATKSNNANDKYNQKRRLSQQENGLKPNHHYQSMSNLTTSQAKCSSLSLNTKTFSSDQTERPSLTPSSQKTYGSSQPTCFQNTRRLSQSQVQQEIEQIHLNSKQKQTNLIGQFNKLKQQAREAIKAQQEQMMNSSQPLNPAIYDERMQRFEQIIETLIDKQNHTQQELEQAKKGLRHKSQLSKEPHAQTAREKSKPSLGSTQRGRLQESQDKIQVPKKSCEFRSNQMSATQRSKAFNNSYESTKGQRRQSQQQVQPGFKILDQTMPKPANISSLRSNGSQSTLRNQDVQKSLSQQQKQPFNNVTNQQKSLNMASQRQHFKNFLDTLQSLEEHNQNFSDLSTLRGKLISYRDQIKAHEQMIPKSYQNQNIGSALDIILQKMDKQLELSQSKKGLILGEEDIQEPSVEHTKILCESSPTPTEGQINFSGWKNISDNQQISYNKDRGPDALADESFGENNQADVTSTSIYSTAAHKRQQKQFHKSGYQVKHSRYAKQSIYQAESGLLSAGSSETMKQTNGWQQEIRQLKSMLGSMAEDLEQKTLQTTQRFNQQRDSQQCRIL